ncbi:MAG: MBOAT family O-acyltransferase [Gemmataceae bacterium]
MVFSTPLFLFAFLPLVLVTYYLAPRFAKNAVLLLASMAFYLWGEQQYALVLFGSILGNYAFGEWLGRRRSLTLVTLAVAANLLVLVYFKYANFFAENINLLFGHRVLHLHRIHLPLGVSFFTFQGIAYVVDVYTHQVKPAKSPVRYALYAALFPHLVAGPIVRYRDIENQLGERPASLDQFTSGIRRLIIGLAKKLILANTLALYADEVFRLDLAMLAPGAAWLGLACYTLQIYFDFSGYSDMAIGLGKMFGFTFLENFNYPYIATSITDFWRRWHISLSSWLRDYLYIPLGGNRSGTVRTYANLFVVFLLCGLWHGAKWNFLIWGAWHGLFLIFERRVNRRGAENPAFSLLSVSLRLTLLRVYTVAAVMLGWVFFRTDTLSQATGYLAALFNFSGGSIVFADVWNKELALILAIAIPCCTPIVPWIAEHLGERDERGWASAGMEWVGLAVCSALWIAILPCLCAGSYSPFLYFRF